MSERFKRFLEAVERGDFTAACMVAPFGYTSRLRDGRYTFIVHPDSNYPEAEGEGATAIQALGNATRRLKHEMRSRVTP